MPKFKCKLPFYKDDVVNTKIVEADDEVDAKENVALLPQVTDRDPTSSNSVDAVSIATITCELYEE